MKLSATVNGIETKIFVEMTKYEAKNLAYLLQMIDPNLLAIDMSNDPEYMPTEVSGEMTRPEILQVLESYKDKMIQMTTRHAEILALANQLKFVDRF